MSQSRPLDSPINQYTARRRATSLNRVFRHHTTILRARLWIQERLRPNLKTAVFLCILVIFVGTVARLLFLIPANVVNGESDENVNNPDSNARFPLTNDTRFIDSNLRPYYNDCNNTKQGPTFITDSNGVLCYRTEVLRQSSCCRHDNIEIVIKTPPLFERNNPIFPARYSCDFCHEKSSCCSNYEGCVSCCLHPSHEYKLLRLQKRTKHFVFHDIRNVFDFCKLRCRSSSGSVRNGNSYRGKNKYCFGEFSTPLEYVPINSDRMMLSLNNNITESVLSTAPILRSAPIRLRIATKKL